MVLEMEQEKKKIPILEYTINIVSGNKFEVDFNTRLPVTKEEMQSINNILQKPLEEVTDYLFNKQQIHRRK